MTTDIEVPAPTRKVYKLWDDQCKEKALAFCREHGKHPALMAKAAGVSLETLRVYLKKDQDFAQQVQEIVEQGNMELEAEARRRAMDGVTRKKYDKEGNLLEEEQVYSDRLMEKLLEANNPEKFRPKEAGGGAQIAGGVLLVPVAVAKDSSPEELSKKLESLSDFQARLEDEGERSMRDVSPT